MLEIHQSRLLLCSFVYGSQMQKNFSSHEKFRRISGSSVKVSMIKSAGTFERSGEKRSPYRAVSYTHLTLPTNREV